MSNGKWKKIKDIKVGDHVKNSLGENAKVIRAIDRIDRGIYKMTFSDGGYVMATQEHEFPMLLKHDGKIKKKTVRWLLNRKDVSISKRAKFISTVIKYKEQSHFISPYLLGCLLGDGSIKKVLAFHNIDKEVLKKVGSELDKIGYKLRHREKCSYGIVLKSSKENKGCFIEGELVTALKELKLYGTNCDNKFIPSKYKYDSEKNRLKLLAGLIDTDGTNNEFTSKSKALAEGFCEIVRSLSGKATLNKTRKSCTYKGKKSFGTYYRVYYKLNQDIPVVLDRKKHTSKRKPNYSYRILRNIEYVGLDDTCDITISTPDHCFISYDWIVTGNCGKTEIGAVEVAKALTGRHKLIKAPCEAWSFCPSFDEQKDTTQAKLLKYIADEEIDWKKTTTLRKGIYKELHLKIGSKVTFKSYEQGRVKAQGAGKALIWFDEEPPKDLFEECWVRVEAGVELRFIMTMTPINGMTWIYDEIYLSPNPDYFKSQAGWDHNPHLTESQKDRMSRGLSKAAIQVRKHGKFTKQTGLVCAWFEREVHVVEMKELPIGNTFFGIDFGFSAYCAGLYVRVDRDMNFWIYDGFYRKGLTNPQIQDIMKVKDGVVNGIVRIGDCAQAADIQQLTNAGYEIIPVKKTTGSSKENWDEYRAKIMQQYGAIQKDTGKPKIFISKDLMDLDDEGVPFNFFVKECENLRWEESKTALGIQQKSIWGSQPNHAIDTFSYILAMILREPEGESEEDAMANYRRMIERSQR